MWPGVHPREERTGGARHRHADAWLQDAVALGDPPQAGVEVRAIERVRDDADELAGRVPRQPGVAVERDDVAHAGQQFRVADMRGEAGIARAAEQPVELLELAPLPLPADPRLLARVPLPDPMKEVEGAGASRLGARVQRLDARRRRGEDRVVGRHHGRRRVGEVAQDGEMDVRVAVAQREHLEVLDQLGDPAYAREQRRDHDHGAMLRRDAAHEIDARQPARGPDARREPLHDGDGELRCRQAGGAAP